MKEMDSQSKTSLKLQAYQYLKTKILNCEYRPNEFPKRTCTACSRCACWWSLTPCAPTAT